MVKKTLGLAYSIVGVDLILAPATPSNTARAGGIMFPIIKSLSESFGSKPKIIDMPKWVHFLFSQNSKVI
ncbi:anion permease [Staphylococcus aureus]